MLIKILVLPKIHNSNGRKFTTYRTKMNLVHADNIEAGEVETWLDLKFGKEVSPADIAKVNRRGIIEVDSDLISVPYRYKITEETNEETGESIKKYPVVWLHGFASFTPSKSSVKQSLFPLDDEEETREVEIA